MCLKHKVTATRLHRIVTAIANKKKTKNVYLHTSVAGYLQFIDMLNLIVFVLFQFRVSKKTSLKVSET